MVSAGRRIASARKIVWQEAPENGRGGFVDRLVDKHFSKMENAYRWLWAHPELGYREWKSHGYMADAFRKLGYALV